MMFMANLGKQQNPGGRKCLLVWCHAEEKIYVTGQAGPSLQPVTAITALCPTLRYVVESSDLKWRSC